MPANVVSIHNSRRHNTAAEREAAEFAEASLSREKVSLKRPKIVKDDEVANRIWNTTIRRMKGISLLDDLDSDTLAQYCLIAARLERLNLIYQEAVKFDAQNAPEKILIRMEAGERNLLSYAEKLGLTPAGRVRLAKKRAEEKQIDPNADLYGDD